MHGIAAATCAPGNIDIFYLEPFFSEPNFSMGHMAWTPTEAPLFHKLGGQFTTVPAAIGFQAVHRPPQPEPAPPPLQCRTDVFCVGADFAMYHQTLWNSVPAPNPQWTSLGGTFTSAPAAVKWEVERIDVFGLGLDRAMYRKIWDGTTWSSEWDRLGGTFSSGASAVSWAASRIDVFARGADFTLRHRAFNNSGPLTDWQNLGGSLASPPAAVTWGPDRLDVFAIGHDGALWHRWWDGDIWNDWESLGGAFGSAPTVAAWAPNRMDVFAKGTDDAVYHFWWSDETWNGPESFGGAMTSAPTAISVAPNRLDVFAPGRDQDIYRRTFDGAAWTDWSGLLGGFGDKITLPTRYRFSVDFVTADTVRSLIEDTDSAQATVAPGNWPTQTFYQFIGDIGGPDPSQAETNLLNNTEPIAVEMCEGVRFNYIVINNGHADQVSLTNTLTAAGSALAGAAVGAAGGSILGAVAGWLLGKLGAFLFQDCDGIVAVEQMEITGRDLYLKTSAGELDSVITTHPGTDSPAGCGDNSLYRVTWSIKWV